jgi:hypothetical protein
MFLMGFLTAALVTILTFKLTPIGEAFIAKDLKEKGWIKKAVPRRQAEPSPRPAPAVRSEVPPPARGGDAPGPEAPDGGDEPTADDAQPGEPEAAQ